MGVPMRSFYEFDKYNLDFESQNINNQRCKQHIFATKNRSFIFFLLQGHLEKRHFDGFRM